MPSVPWVSLLSQASTKPPRVWPKVRPSISVATVLPAPPFGLTTVIWRSPPKARRTAARFVATLPLAPVGPQPDQAERAAPGAARTPVVATHSRGRTARRVANSSAVGTG